MNITLPNDFTPRAYQLPFMGALDSGVKRAFCVWHRRAGKDLVAAHQTNKLAHLRRGLYWHMLPSLKQARKTVWNGFTNDGKRIIKNVFPDELVANSNETEMRLELKCGSIWQLVGADNFDSLVGSNPVGVVFSEFALTHPRSYDFIRPILAANGGWAAFITTPRGMNHAWELWNRAKADKSWFTQLLTVEDTSVLPMSVIEEERRNGMPEALIRQEYYCDFTAALVGAVWGDLVEQLDREGRIAEWDLTPADRREVFVSFDLGVSDSTAIWFWRANPAGNGIEFIDYYESNGKPISYYADVVEGKGYGIRKVILPHDAKARTLATDLTVFDQLRHRWPGKVVIGPRLSLQDGIHAGRWLLQQPGTRFHAAQCAAGLKALRQYHYEYDEEAKTYSTRPEHDWSSHAADAFRYAAVMAKVAKFYSPSPAAEKKEPVIGPAHHSFTLDMLWADHERERRYERRID